MATPKNTPKAATTRKPATPRPASKHRSPKPDAKAGGALSTTAAFSIGAIAVAAGAGLVAFLTRGRIAELLHRDEEDDSDGYETGSEGHIPTDLMTAAHRNADDRAVADFRPNIDAVMTAAEREALRPATGPAPSLIADRGEMNSQTAPAN